VEANYNASDKYSYTFSVDLELFAGPIDLLLHLVKQNELPIDKISLGQVAEQYLFCLERICALDVEIAGEYLVIASTLLAIKAKTILNDSLALEGDSEEDSEDSSAYELNDPHDLLLEKVRQAELFQTLAKGLGEFKQLGQDAFLANISYENSNQQETLAKQPAVVLGRALKSMIKRRGKDLATYEITVDEVSISERMNQIIETFTKLASENQPLNLSFSTLVNNIFGENCHIGYLISLFLALLELCKRQVIAVEQVSISDSDNIVDFSVKWLLK
jgi:segregation and condensation protein A